MWLASNQCYSTGVNISCILHIAVVSLVVSSLFVRILVSTDHSLSLLVLASVTRLELFTCFQFSFYRPKTRYRCLTHLTNNMRASTRYAALVATLLATATALDGIVVPSEVSADQQFQATFSNGNSDQYRVFLAAALAGTNGPTC